MEKPKIAVFTRIHYPGEIPEHTLYCFEHYFLKSIKSQNYTDFDLIIICNKNVTNNNIVNTIIKKHGITNIKFIDSVCFWGNLSEFNYDIQINLDCDDAMPFNYIETIVNEYYSNDKDTFLMVFTEYYKLDIKTNIYYQCSPPTKENNGFPTPFYAVVQKKEKSKAWGQRKHNEMDEIFKDIVIIKHIHPTMTIHGNNLNNKIYNNEKPL